MRWPLTPYGNRQLLWTTAVAAAATAGACALGALAGWGWTLLAGPPLLLWGWVLWFFRDPRRVPPNGPGLLVSPADGRIADLTPLGADGPLGEEALRIGVFMSLFNVHVNRSPAAARIEGIEHVDGVFLDARSPDAAERNESTTIRMSCQEAGTAGREFLVRQVAGLVARRIVTDIQTGQAVARSERIGMIKFGSRLELIVPQAWSEGLAVRVGQPVYAGETILIRIPEGTNDDPATS